VLIFIEGRNNMADNTVGVRDYLGRLIGAGNVGYDEKTKGVTATVGGKTYNLGNEGMTLGEDGRYYAQSEDYLKNLLINRTGYEGVRNTVQAQGGSVGWANNQVIINGQAYNTDGMINANGTLYADPNFLNSLNKQNTFTNPYQQKQEDLFNKLYNSKFNYNPNTDNALHAAQKQAQNSVTRDTARRGILNSTDAAYYSGLAASSLVPQYEQMAYSRYQDENQKLVSLANMLSNMSTQQLAEWQANNTQRYNITMLTLQREHNEQEKLRNEIEKAYKKVELLGYADNETAVILGVDPNTPAASVRQAMLEKQNQLEIEEARTDEKIRALEAEYNLQSTIGMDIYEQKAAIDLETSKDLATFQTDEDIRRYQATTGARESGSSGGISGSSGGDPVATALQDYAVNNGLGSYLNMSLDEIAAIINSVVADEETRQWYYAQYGITSTPATTTDYTQPYIPGAKETITGPSLLKGTYGEQ
jgi:hypothetical protein